MTRNEHLEKKHWVKGILLVKKVKIVVLKGFETSDNTGLFL